MIDAKTQMVNEESSLPNFAINEGLAFIKMALLPLVSKDLMADKELCKAFVDFIDVVALHWDPNRLIKGRDNDPEEFLYQETMLHVYSKVAVITLQALKTKTDLANRLSVYASL